MFELVVNGRFEAAHRLVGYNGKCSQLHGHSWLVEMSVSGNSQDPIGIHVDFKILKGMLNELLENMDHQYLNELSYFEGMNPTAENIAQFIYRYLSKNEVFTNGDCKLKYIKVWESPKAAVIYTE